VASYDSGQRQVVGCCEDGDGPLDSVKEGNCLSV
jgi:hypothetical protein